MRKFLMLVIILMVVFIGYNQYQIKKELSTVQEFSCNVYHYFLQHVESNMRSEENIAAIFYKISINDFIIEEYDNEMDVVKFKTNDNEGLSIYYYK